MKGKREERRGAGEGGEGPRAGGRRSYGRCPREFSTMTRGGRLQQSLPIPPLVLFIPAASKTGWRELYHRPVSALLTPPVWGVVLPHRLQAHSCDVDNGGGVDSTHCPLSVPFHTPQGGGFSAGNEDDDGAAYDPHAVPRLTRLHGIYARSGILEGGRCAAHTPPPFTFCYPPVEGIPFFLQQFFDRGWCKSPILLCLSPYLGGMYII